VILEGNAIPAEVGKRAVSLVYRSGGREGMAMQMEYLCIADHSGMAIGIEVEENTQPTAEILLHEIHHLAETRAELVRTRQG